MIGTINTLVENGRKTFTPGQAAERVLYHNGLFSCWEAKLPCGTMCPVWPQSVRENTKTQLVRWFDACGGLRAIFRFPL